MSKKSALASLLFVLVVSGCVGMQFNKNYKPYTALGGGYSEKNLGDGSWLVTYFGGVDDFAFRCARYRSAELTYEKGKRFFRVLSAKDNSGTVHGGMEMGQRSSVYMGNGEYKIKLLNGQVVGKDVFDAYQILDKEPVPGSNKPKTVAERKQ